MKKKVIAIALYIALLMTSLVPVTALAVGDTEGGMEPDAPLCTCTTKCAEGAVNSACPVCGAEGAEFAQVCKGQVPQPDGDQGGSTPDGENEPGDDEGKPGPSTRSATVLEITDVTLVPKTYDGTTVGEVMEYLVETIDSSGPIGDPSFTFTVEYYSADAGTNRTATVTVTLTGDDYIFEGGEKVTTYTLENQTIKKCPVKLAWGNTSFTYDGEPHSVSATISNVVGDDDVQPVYGGTTSATEASASYTATVTELSGEDAGNYTLEGGTNTSQDWSIKIDITYDTTVYYNGGLRYYNGKAQEPDYYISAFNDTGKKLLNGTDYTLSYENNIDAGRATIMVHGKGKYTGTATGYFTIKPCPLTISGATLAAKTYDGSIAGTVESVEFTGVPEGQSLKPGTDYSATVEYNDPDAGDDRTATVTVMLTNSNYSFGDGGTVAIYELENQKIAKAYYEGETTATGYVVSNSSLHSVKLPELPEGASYGEPEYSGGDDAVTSLSITDGILHYSGGSGIMSGGNYTVTVPVAGSSNYEDYDITVTLTGSYSVVLTGGPSLSTDTITYGQKLMDIGFSGTMYAGATPVSGTFTWVAPDTMPKAGPYEAEWEFTPGDAGYSTASGTVQITVNKRPVELDWGTTVFTYDGEPHSVSATISNVVGNDDVVPVYGGTLNGTEIKTYAATVTGLGGTDAANYTIVGVADASQEWSIKSPVILVSSVTMSRSSLRIYEGRSYTLSATVKPDDATDRGIVWSSSDNSIATVDQKGTVTGHKPGTVTIAATAADGSGVSASCVVRVLRWYPGATPITGDSSHLGLWIGVLAVSAAAIGAAAFILIKKRKKK